MILSTLLVKETILWCVYIYIYIYIYIHEQPLQGMELQEKEAQKRLKHTRNLFRKNLQLIGVCQF